MINSKIKVLFAIADYSLSGKMESVFKKEKVPVSYILQGNGSTNSEMLELLGLVDSKKIVFISFIPESKVEDFYTVLDSELGFGSSGTGIAFTLFISSISSTLYKMYAKAEFEKLNKSEAVQMAHNYSYELILTIVTMGKFDNVMDVAKKAGATGGTLLHARGLASEEAIKYLGITIQPEKDVVLIVAPRDLKQPIMDAIAHEMNLNSDGKGICISIPVDSVNGLKPLNQE